MRFAIWSRPPSTDSTPDHVVLVDADGNLPLGPKTPEAIELSAEQALEDKLVATLEPVTGAGNVRASVTLDYNSTATDETEETYDPEKTATLEMQRTEQSSGPQPVAAGVPGAASNAPNTQALPVYPRETTSPSSAKTESSTYGVSKTVRHTVDNPGRVRRLTAAIVVNDRLVEPATKKQSAVWQRRSADELRNLTTLAQAAVGFDATRGDMLTVEDLAFDENRPQPPVAMPRAACECRGELAGAGKVFGLARRFGGGDCLRAAACDSARGSCAGEDRRRQGAPGTGCQNRACAGLAGAAAGGGIGSGAIADAGDLRSGDDPSEARADTEFAPPAELDSLRVGARSKNSECGKGTRFG